MSRTVKRKFAYSKDKENINLPKELISKPISEKIQKFGKSIRLKAFPKFDPTTPLKQRVNEQNISRRQSEPFEDTKPLIDDVNNMSVSFISHTQQTTSQFDQFNNFSKIKNVRFREIDENQSNSKSKSKRKNSILKNCNSSEKSSAGSITSHVGQICGGLNTKASIKDKGIDCRNQKYQTTLSYLKQKDRKYFDDMFPPGGASLFYTKSLSQKFEGIRWMRINQVFQGKKLVLYCQEDRNLIQVGNYWQFDYMVSAFNAIGTSQRCMQKIFENQRYSQYGIYYLRLNHGGIWKYVIIDDYVPVKKVGKSFVPVFLNVKPPKSQYLELWPFLLQKAMAKMYSTYESLMGDSFQNCMNQLTGILPETIIFDEQIMNNKNAQMKINHYLLNSDNILVAGNPLKNSKYIQQYYPCVQIQRNQRTYFSDSSKLKLLGSHSNTYEEYCQDISYNFSEIKAYLLDDTFCSVGCIIKQQKAHNSLRKFMIHRYTNCTISLTQKDRKYYRNNGYQYTYIRLILVKKDIDGFRWIDGSYRKQKIINLNCKLEPGQYYVIIMSEWGKKVFDITLNYQGTSQIQFARESLEKNPNIISETCRDIAQRFGIFKQINKNICSYQYIDKQNGFIIENLNNQLDRQAYFHRKYTFFFINYRTIADIHFIEDRQIEGFIMPQSNLTLAIMLLGGINQDALQNFYF